MLDTLINLARGVRKGQPYGGTVVYCSDPSVIRWPGPHAVGRDGSPDKRRPVVFDREHNVWREGRSV